MNPVQEKIITEMGIGPIWKLRPDSNEQQILPQEVIPMHSSPISSNSIDLRAQVQIEDTLGLESNKATCQVCGWSSITLNDSAPRPSSNVIYLFIRECTNGSEIDTVPELADAAEALLNNILRELRLKRGSSAYVASIVKTKPNDVLSKGLIEHGGEVSACVSCTKKQIELIRPSVIISLGNNSAISLLGLEGATTITDLRRTLYRYDGTPLIVTHELDYLLQHPKEKLSLWSDFCFAMSAIQIQ